MKLGLGLASGVGSTAVLFFPLETTGRCFLSRKIVQTGNEQSDPLKMSSGRVVVANERTMHLGEDPVGNHAPKMETDKTPLPRFCRRQPCLAVLPLSKEKDASVPAGAASTLESWYGMGRGLRLKRRALIGVALYGQTMDD